MQLVIRALSKQFGGQRVLHQIDMQIETGQLACLLGASGCGKTTLLRCVAGFESIDSGQIALDDQIVSGPGCQVPPQQRSIGMVFQDHALFPHLSVAQNAAFGLHRWPRAERRKRVEEVLALVGLSALAFRFPHQLSGGQQQRAALARALANQPRLMLLDEPFANLDRDLRYRLAQDVAQILERSGTSALWVTHDQKEAMIVADEIGVMNNGEIEQWDKPATLYHFPATRFIAEFLGECSFLQGSITPDGAISTVLGCVDQADGQDIPPGTPVDVLMRPDQLAIGEGMNATILRQRFQGADTLCEVGLQNGEKLLLLNSSDSSAQVGQQIRIRWKRTTASAYIR